MKSRSSVSGCTAASSSSLSSGIHERWMNAERFNLLLTPEISVRVCDYGAHAKLQGPYTHSVLRRQSLGCDSAVFRLATAGPHKHLFLAVRGLLGSAPNRRSLQRSQDRQFLPPLTASNRASTSECLAPMREFIAIGSATTCIPRLTVPSTQPPDQVIRAAHCQ